MQLSRAQLARLWRPQGPQLAQSRAWTNGGSSQITQGIDLSRPIYALTLEFTGRLVVGTADFTTSYPESFLNLISRIQLFGINKRKGGDATLLDTDLATLFVLQHLFERRPATFIINGTNVAEPTSPFPTIQSLVVGTYDWRIVVNIPFAPFGAHPGVRPGFLVRSQEWGESLQMQFNYGTQQGNATGALGVAAATTTVTFSSFGSATGDPQIRVFLQPVIMGDLRGSVIPGMLTRVNQMFATTAALSNGDFGPILQKRATTRIFVKNGTSVLPNNNPAFATLLDTNVDDIGLELGDHTIRNLASVFAHKQDVQSNYPAATAMIQGYCCLDFLESGNPDSAFPGDQISEGAYLKLKANVDGVANGQAIVIQEQMILRPEGELYS